MKTFREKVIEFVRVVPRGKVVNYGQVAAACGSPRAARQVGGVLRSLDEKRDGKVPWWRVINSQGILSIKGNWIATKEMQAELLRKEGVEVQGGFQIDMAKYRYK